VERFSLDSMIFDHIAESEETIELVERLVEARKIELVATHVQRDEIAAIPDQSKRERIARIPVADVATYGFVIGISRIGMARLGPEAPYEAMAGPNRGKYANDALIAMTAQFEDTVLVSDDRRLRNRAQDELRIEAWNWQQFRDYLHSLAQAT
jgi:predicted nucleic acid-binding protein